MIQFHQASTSNPCFYNSWKEGGSNVVMIRAKIRVGVKIKEIIFWGMGGSLLAQTLFVTTMETPCVAKGRYTCEYDRQ